MVNTGKNIKIILFVSLIVAMVIPASTINFVEAKKNGWTQKDLDKRFEHVSEIYSNEKLDDLKEKISKSGTVEKSKIKDNGLTIKETKGETNR